MVQSALPVLTQPLIQSLARTAAKDSRRIIGLMSGTSADGVDAALIEVVGSGSATEVNLLQFASVEMATDIRRRLFRLFESDGSLDELCKLNVGIGEAFAAAALDVIEAAGLGPADVDLIGSHGQTVRHLPGEVEGSTLQIGEAAVIAQRTGITTIADFRAADMAVGGQGAPLVPLVDHLLFADSMVGRVMLNLGGIANLTVLPAGLSAESVEAFDLGPANMLIDGAVAHVTGGVEGYDRDGLRAAAGRVDESLLAELMHHDFIFRPPPKSTGREAFGQHFLRLLLKRSDVSGNDLIATLSAFAAKATAHGIRQFVLSRHDVREVWVSGGGVHNSFVMDYLRDQLGELKVGPLSDLGMSPDAKEAVTFAILANETLMGNPGNLPSATGAGHAAVLGKIVPGRLMA